MAEVVNEVRTAQHVVTGDNRAEFMAKRLDLAQPMTKVVAPDTKDAKPTDADVVDDIQVLREKKGDEPAPKKEQPIQERFGKMAEQRKAAEARAAAAEARATAAEREAQELKSKAAPAAPETKIEEVEAKPRRESFATEAEFTENLVDWSIKKDRIERAAEAEKAREETERSKVLADWQSRLTKAKSELPDYQEKIDAAASVTFSDQVRDAILESDVGPRILYHFAEHPEEAEALKGMTALAAVRRIGRLEAELTPPKKAATSLPEEKRDVHVSKAPAPISALKASSAPENLVGSDGKFKGDFKQYKALRKEGKI